MAYSRGNSLSSDCPAPELSSTKSSMISLPVHTPTSTFSRSTSPASTRASSTSTSSDTWQDSTSSSTSSSSLDTNQFDSFRTRPGSIDSCDEHACSKCRLSEEEHRRIKAERRKEQNRASQRRFRAKKENEIRGAADQVASLESMIQDLQKHNMELSQTNVALMARLAELENQRSYNPRSEHSIQCQHCHKIASPDPASDIIDYFWPIENAENQHVGQLGSYLPLFDLELMPFEA